MEEEEPTLQVNITPFQHLLAGNPILKGLLTTMPGVDLTESIMFYDKAGYSLPGTEELTRRVGGVVTDARADISMAAFTAALGELDVDGPSTSLLTGSGTAFLIGDDGNLIDL